ncbi:hypothetical protein ACTHPJ_10615 [Paenibacillus amylolyticus]
MRYALLAEIERRLGHPERAIQYAQEAVNASNGVERYMLVKEYERYNAACGLWRNDLDSKQSEVCTG